MSVNNPYTKTDWIDHIVDTSNGEVLQEGTRFTARRANNIEDGIYGAYTTLDGLNREIKRLRIQLEIDGRLPGNSGSYVDAFDGNPSRLMLDMAQADVTASASIGATTLNVSDATVFDANTQVTIYDGTNFEDVVITKVNTKTIVVTAMTKAFDKGAKVARSNVRIVAESNEMRLGNAGTYAIINAEVV